MKFRSLQGLHTIFLKSSKERKIEKVLHLGQAKKMFVCENRGGEKNVHQSGRKSIFFLIFRYIQTKFSKEQKNKQTLKVNKANYYVVLSTTIYIIPQWRSVKIRHVHE